MQISVDKEDSLLKTSGRKRDDGGPIVYLERPQAESKSRDTEAHGSTYWVSPKERETRLEYAERLSNNARIAETYEKGMKPITMKAVEGKGSGIKRWHEAFGPNNATFIMKGCPKDWGTITITEFLKAEGYTEVGELSPPQPRARGMALHVRSGEGKERTNKPSESDHE